MIKITEKEIEKASQKVVDNCISFAIFIIGTMVFILPRFNGLRDVILPRLSGMPFRYYLYFSPDFIVTTYKLAELWFKICFNKRLVAKIIKYMEKG